MSAPAFDLIVVGAGMAGLTAAAVAADSGARVLVLERNSQVGGNALVSGSYLWTLRSLPAVRQASPQADAKLQAAMYGTFPRAVELVHIRGAVVRGPVTVMNRGRGYLLDMPGYLGGCVRAVEARGGAVVRDIDVRQLLRVGDGVSGVSLRDGTDDVEVTAGNTLLATGGFQADAALRETYLGTGGQDLALRSSAFSDGAGLRLAMGVGAAFTDGNQHFYGHLLPSDVALDDLTRFRKISLYHSEHSLLLDGAGRRITDESLGDEVSNEALFRQTSDALLLWDEHVQQSVVMRPYPPGSPGEDRFELVRALGGQAARAGSLATLAKNVAAWGFDSAGILETLTEYNREVATRPERLSPTRMWNDRPMDLPPFYAVRCRPSVTFPHGGIRIDARARALSVAGAPIPGLLVAGVDAGDVMRGGYSGGLAQAATLALLACDTAGFR